ncbi:helix-hairpin-helix domain-containing protein [Nocardioides sp. R1-1]|uniref:helix-hairpin-helix domain-containing protein n=1 Tax=Nocardioides sp. R1-1 TaxID=3383502 RepID=UPI0038CF9AD4
MSVRRPASRHDPSAAEAAARRLALIASDLGVAGPRPPAPLDPTAPREPVEPWWADHTRVVASAPSAPSAPVVPRAAGAAPALPQPGRHAARRSAVRSGHGPAAGRVVARLPSLGLPQLTVVAIAVALALAVTTWWVVRDRPDPLRPVSAAPAAPLVTPAGGSAASRSDPTATAGGAGGTGATATAETVTVDVAGEVRRPGIVVLDAGARVTDALAAAGGPRKGVDLTPLNLARVLVDGEQVVVGAAATGPGGAGGAGGSGASRSGAAATGTATGPLVNLNTAGVTELESLPQVGPVTAEAILAWREAHGGFTSVEELLEVDGIGEKTLAQITPHVTV